MSILFSKDCQRRVSGAVERQVVRLVRALVVGATAPVPALAFSLQLGTEFSVQFHFGIVEWIVQSERRLLERVEDSSSRPTFGLSQRE